MSPPPIGGGRNGTLAAMARMTVVLAGVAAACAVGLGGCGADAPSRDELVHALELTGISSEKAECAADAVLENLSDEQIVRLVERGPAGAPRDDPDRSDDAADQVREALTECRQVGAEAPAEP